MYTTRTTNRIRFGSGVTNEARGCMELCNHDGAGAPLSDWRCINHIPATKVCDFVAFSPRKQQQHERYSETHPVHENVSCHETHVYLDRPYSSDGDALCVTVPVFVLFAHRGGMTQTPAGMKICGIAYTCNGRLMNLQTLCLTAQDIPRLPSMSEDFVLAVVVLASAVNYATIKVQKSEHDAFVFNNQDVASLMLEKVGKPGLAINNANRMQAKGMVANLGVYPVESNLSTIAADVFMHSVETCPVRFSMQLFVKSAHVLVDRAGWKRVPFLFPDMLVTTATTFPQYSIKARTFKDVKGCYHLHGPRPNDDTRMDDIDLGDTEKQTWDEHPCMSREDVMCTRNMTDGLQMHFSWDSAFMQLMEWKSRAQPRVLGDGSLFDDETLMSY